MGRRIKDFEYTASAFSPDDYIAIDGETQGTRNMQYSTLVAEMSAAIGGGGQSSGEIKSVYIDPKNGSDTNSGTDRHNPVATSRRAYAVMEELGLDTVVILDKIALVDIGEVEGIYFDPIPQSLVLETFNIVNEVDGSICIVLDTLPANSKIASYNDAVITLAYKNGLRANLEIESKSSVELHHYLPGNDYGYPIANLKVNTAGDFYLNCVQYQESEYGYYPDDYLYNSYITSSITVKSKNAYLVGLYEYGAEIYVEATENITNSLEGSSEEPFDDNRWTTIENTMKFIAPNGTIYALQGGYAKDYIVDCLNFNGHSQVVVKNLTQIHATGYCDLMDILSGDVEAKGRVIVTGGDESQNTVLNTTDCIMPHNTSEGNCYDYAPEVFIDWKGLIHHTSNSFYVNKYFERSNGYTEDSERLYIEALEVDHYDENAQIVYNTNPIEIISSGTVRNLYITTGIDVTSGKFVPVHIKCKNLVSNGICIYSHDILVEAENDIQYDSNYSGMSYFQIMPSVYYQDFRPNGFIDKTVAANARLIANRNVEFLPGTDTTDEVNQTVKINAGNELILQHYTGNNGITSKALYVKARRMSGEFRNINTEIHIDVDEFLSTPYNIFEIDGGSVEAAAASTLTTQSTFHAKTIVMQARDYTVSPVEQNKGIFAFLMSDSYPTVVRNLDIQVGVIACDFDWGGGIYCPLLYSCSTYNGEISGVIGTIINTYNGKIHKVTRWQHDLIFYQPDDITSWKTGARVSLHFADRSSPSDIFVDPDQGDDRFDGLTASRPVKTAVGLYRALKAQGYISLDHSNHYVKINPPIALHMLSGYSGGNRGSSSNPSSGNYSLQLFVNRGMTGDTDLQESYNYEFWFGSDLEIVPEAPNLRVSFQYLNSNYQIIEARGFESFYVDGYAGSVFIVEAANVIRINNNGMTGPVTNYWSRWNGGYNIFKSREIELRGRFYNIVADADYQFSIYDTTGGTPWSTDNCCMTGYTKIHSVEYLYLGNSNSHVGINGIGSIRSDLYINAYLDTILGELNIDAGSGITGSIGSSFMRSRLRMRSKSITLLSGSFNGTANMGDQSNYPGSYIDIEAEQSISSSGTSSISFFRCDVNIKTKYLYSPELVLYGDQYSKSIIEAEAITPTISYRLGNVTIKATRSSNIVNRLQGGPISVSGNYAENLYLDINEFSGYIYLPYESSQYNYASNIFARVGTTYQPIVYWGFDPSDPQTPVVGYNLSVTVEHSKYNPSGTATKKSNYGDAIPANASGEILILNDMEVEIPQPQVVNKTAVIPSGTTVAGVELENDNYNVIATIPAEATELDVHFPESTDKVQESGFQFDVEANSQLALIKAFITGRRLPVNAPSTFTDGMIYQGSSVNGIVVVAEFEPFTIVISSIQTDNPTSSSVDIVLTGTNVENNLEYDLVLTSENGERTVHTTGSTYTLSGSDFSFYDSAADLAATVIIGGVNYGSYALKGYPPIFDGRLYKFIKIGNQTWLTENLDYKFNGLQLNNTTWDYSNKQADYYNFDEELGKKYGLLYNFKAIEYLNNNRSTLTTGWKVPTKSDYETLISFAGGTDTAGSKLRAVGEWNNQSTSDTNSLKFSALPGGEGYNDGNNNAAFEHMGLSGYFNTITPYSSNTQYQNEAIWITNSPVIYFQPGKNYPFSVRLIRETVTVSITNNTSGLVTTSSTHTLPSGDVTIPLTFNDGSDPSCVSSSRGTVTSAGVVITGVTSNTTITLTRAKAQVNVVNGFSDGIDSISPTSQYVAPGTDATFTITYKSGYSASNVMTDTGTISGSTLTVPVPSGSTSTITATLSEKTTSVVIGGRSYRTTMIGDQEWMAENLDWQFSGLTMSTSANPIAPSADTGTDPVGWYYNNDTSYATKCGMLYNFYAAARAAELVGDGWAVPDSFNSGRLTRYLSNKYSTGSGSPNYQPALKAIDNSVDGNWPTGWNGTNELKFNMRPVGTLLGSNFSDYGTKARLWGNWPGVWVPSNNGTMAFDQTGTGITTSYDAAQYYGLSVRLVRNRNYAGSVEIGGRKYPTTIIGNQQWMTESLDFQFNGLTVGGSTPSYSDPCANYYSNNASRYGLSNERYGLLYNWAAVQYITDHLADLVPSGWHIPTAAEWDTLINAVGGSSVAGRNLKATSGWGTEAAGGTGEYGFIALPGGVMNSSGQFQNEANRGYYWTATSDTSTTANDVEFINSQNSLSATTTLDKSSECYIRLVKDVQ